MRDGAPERLLIVLGASGAGKSSFLRAGLLARVARDTEDFLVLPVARPGRAALTGPDGLLRALGVNADADASTIATRLAALRAPVVEEFRRRAAAAEETYLTKPPSIVLPIDQAEEFFAAEHAEAAQALDLLATAFASDPGLLALVTIRTDSFEQLQGEQRLAGIPRLPFDLPRLSTAAFKDVIEGPGRLARPPISIEPALTDRLVADLDAADALPLLAFTLERLVLDHGPDGKLELQEYLEGLQGLKGAISKAVEAALDQAQRDPALPNGRVELEALARRAFIPWLVRVDDTEGAPKRRVAMLSELPPDTQGLVQKFVDQRLLVSDVRLDGAITVEVSHEALLRNWTQLAAWIAEEKDTLGQAERVMQAARDWALPPSMAMGKLSRAGHEVTLDDYQQLMLVHRGVRLANAESLLERDDLVKLMGPRVRQYLRACREREDEEAKDQAAQIEQSKRQLRRQRGLQRWIGVAVAVAFAVTVAGGWFVIDKQRSLSRAQSIMVTTSANTLAEKGDYLRAMRLAIVATHDSFLSPGTTEAELAFASSAQALGLQATLQHDGPIVGAVLSRDESRILSWSVDNTARLWDAASGRQIGPALLHDGPVVGAIFSRDETRILSWSTDGKARLWDSATGKQVGPALRQGEPVTGAAFSKNGTRILTWGDDKTARLWNPETGEQIGPSLKHDDYVSGAMFSSDETRILTWGWDGTARIWDVATGQQIGSSLAHEAGAYGANRVRGAVFAAGETRILTWSGDGTARLWDVSTGKQIGPALKHDKSVFGAVLTADEARILTWSADGTARLWDTNTGTQIGPAFKHDGVVEGARFSKDETRVVTWSDDTTARLWDVATGSQIGRPLEHDKPVVGAVFSKDERRILTWTADSTDFANRGAARLWDVASGMQIGQALEHDGAVLGAMFFQNETRILTWGFEGNLRVWSSSTDQQIGPALEHANGVNGAKFSKDASRILTWGSDGTARLWDASTGKQVGPALKHDKDVYGAAFSKDESRILTWSPDSIRLWNAATGLQIGPDLKHDKDIQGAVFSKDESRVLSWSWDGTARLWDTTTGLQVGASLKHANIVGKAVFSEDNTRILAWTYGDTARLWDVASNTQLGSDLGGDFKSGAGIFHAAFFVKDTRVLTAGSLDGALQEWDAKTGRKIGPGFKLERLEAEKEYVTLGFVLSKDQSRVLAWCENGALHMWDVATHRQLGPELKHDEQVNGAAFSPDESLILSWSRDGTGRLWDASTGKQVGPALKHDREVRGATFSKDGSRILTWSEDGTVRLWDTAAGKQVSALRYNGEVYGAAFSADQTRILSWSSDGTARIWDVRWVSGALPMRSLVAEACESKLRGDRGEAAEWNQDPDKFVRNRILLGDGRPLIRSARNLDMTDIHAAPILLGREGEDVCAWSPPWYDGILRATIGWAFK